MRINPLLAAPMAALCLSGCVSAATSIVKAPFQVVGKAVDWTTTSQEEADRNYGKKMRKKEAEEGREMREAEKQRRKDCERYGGRDC